MTKTASRALALLALFLVLYATASVVATVTQLSSAADRLYDGSGQIVFFSLLGIFGFLAAMPAALYFRLPKPLHPPATMEGPEFVEYQAGLLLALRRNPRLAGVPMDSVGDLAGALEALSKIADAEIKKSAGSIFVTTALMQNGKLDGLLMLATQARLVWRVAGIYYRRPSPRQMLYMYSNVGAAVLIATDIDDVDFAGMASPVVASIAPSLAGAVPGLQGIGSLLTNSLADGAANAFLTLRVGLIAKAYCAPMIEPQIGLIRRSASIQALAMVGGIARENGAKVMKAIWHSATGPVTGAKNAAVRGIKTASSKVATLTTTTASSVGGALSSTADYAKTGASAVAGGTVEVGRRIGRAASATADGAVTITNKASQAAVSMVRRKPVVDGDEPSHNPPPGA